MRENFARDLGLGHGAKQICYNTRAREKHKDKLRHDAEKNKKE